MGKAFGGRREIGRSSRRAASALGRAARSAGIAALIAGPLVSLLPASGGPSGPVALSPPGRDALEAAWSDYKSRYVTPDGRVVDDANGGVSHSEGQGFGMLLAASLGDRRAFALLWKWTARELYRRPDGLASWRWVPGTARHLTDSNNATDGDLLIAWALLRASERWDDADYRGAARRIALAVGEHATFQSRFGFALKPAASGFGPSEMTGGPVVNLSYWVFPALAALPQVAPEVDWRALTRTGLALLDATRLGRTGLPPDWIALADAPGPAAGFPPVFSYDAVRIPLYLVWSGLGTSEAYAPFLRLVQHGAAPAVVDLSTGRAGLPLGEPGYGAVFEMSACAGGGNHGSGAVTATALPASQHYYPSSLQLLAALAARDAGLSCR